MNDTHEHDWRHATGDRDTRQYDCAHPECGETLTVPRRWGSVAHAAATIDAPDLEVPYDHTHAVAGDLQNVRIEPVPPPIRGEDDDDWGRLLARVTAGLADVAPTHRRRESIESAAANVRGAPLLRSRPGEHRHAELAVYAELEKMRDSADHLMTLIVDYLADRGAPMGRDPR